MVEYICLSSSLAQQPSRILPIYLGNCFSIIEFVEMTYQKTLRDFVFELFHSDQIEMAMDGSQMQTKHRQQKIKW